MDGEKKKRLILKTWTAIGGKESVSKGFLVLCAHVRMKRKLEIEEVKS